MALFQVEDEAVGAFVEKFVHRLGNLLGVAPGAPQTLVFRKPLLTVAKLDDLLAETKVGVREFAGELVGSIANRDVVCAVANHVAGLVSEGMSPLVFFNLELGGVRV